MPELPDVESYKRYMDATCLHQQIKTVHVRERRILKDVSPSRLRSTLGGRCFLSTVRWGKYLFVETDDRNWLMLHFGMTGFLKYFKNEEKSGPHARLIITFRNGYHLAYVCQRLLGKVRLVNSVDDFTGSNLGPDALAVNFRDFKKIIGKSRGGIKSTLMNQKYMAGIGNIYSDEILFQSAVHPKMQGCKLNDRQIKRIYHNMRKVLKRAIERRADLDKLPRSYLLPHRQRGNSCPRCSSALRGEKIGGRTAYFCPRCQNEKI